MDATIERNWDVEKQAALDWIRLRGEPHQASVIDADGWAVIACETRRESETARWLQFFGSIVFLPKREVEVKVTRRVTPNQRHRGLLRTVLRPMFPGYFFAASLRGDRRDIPGFRSILRSPTVDRAVAALQQAANDTGLIKMPEKKPTAEFSPGDVIRVLEGPFAFFPGVIVEVLPQKVDVQDRIKADIEIFGCCTPIELYIDQIEVVAKARHPDGSARTKAKAA
jgi:transcription antitermination factor NusG